MVTGLTASLVFGISRTSQAGIEALPNASFRHGQAVLQQSPAPRGLGERGCGRFRPRRCSRPCQRRGELAVKRASVPHSWLATVGGRGVGLAITGNVGRTRPRCWRYARPHPALIPTGFVLGTVIATAEIAWYRRKQRQNSPPLSSLAQGAAGDDRVTALATAEGWTADVVAGLIKTRAPGFAGLAEPIGHLVALAPLVGGAWAAVEYVSSDRERRLGGEQAYQRPPPRRVPRGPASQVSWDTLGREGRRFVNMLLPAKEITAVTGLPARDPVRVFVGLASAPTVDARVALGNGRVGGTGGLRSQSAVSGLAHRHRLRQLCVVAETLEYLTEGDCATVALQYSLRPSFLSLDRVALGREQNRALLHAINGRLRATRRIVAPDRRPRESLGAFTLLEMPSCTRHRQGLHRAGMTRASVHRHAG